MTASAKVWNAIERRKAVTAYKSHVETCPLCTADKYCDEAQDIAEKLVDASVKEFLEPL